MNKLSSVISLFIFFLLVQAISIRAQDRADFARTPSLRRIDAHQVNRHELPTDQLDVGFYYNRLNILRTDLDDSKLKEPAVIFKTFFPDNEVELYGNPNTIDLASIIQNLDYTVGSFEDKDDHLDLLHLGVATEQAGQRTLFEDAVESLQEQGTIVVAPAGSEGEQVDGGFLARDTIPAVFDGVVTVSALEDTPPEGKDDSDSWEYWTDKSGGVQFAPWSNYGKSVDVTAPGDPIQNREYNDIDGEFYNFSSRTGDTEDAAQHVSGTISLMLAAAKQEGKSLSRDDVMDIIRKTGEYPEERSWKGDQDTYREPLVDADDAVRAVCGGSECANGYSLRENNIQFFLHDLNKIYEGPDRHVREMFKLIHRTARPVEGKIGTKGDMFYLQVPVSTFEEENQVELDIDSNRYRKDVAQKYMNRLEALNGPYEQVNADVNMEKSGSKFQIKGVVELKINQNEMP